MTYQEWREKNVAKSDGRGTILSSGKQGDTDGFTTLESIRKIDVANESAIKSALDDFAIQYAHADVEHALVLSPDGKRYDLVGLSGTVNTTLAGEDALKDALVIHNHPVANGELMADSFSREDLLFAVRHRTGAQYLTSGSRRDWFRYSGTATVDEAYRAYDRAKDDVLERAFDGELTIEAEREQEEIMKVLNKYLEGFEYHAGF